MAEGNTEVQPDQEPTAEEVAWLQSQLLAATLRDEGGSDEWTDPSDGKLQQLYDMFESDEFEEALTLLDDVEVAYIDVPGPDGDTLLHLASLYGQLTCVQKLLERGASAGVVNTSDRTLPLHDACAGGYLEIAKLLLEKAPEHIDSTDEDGDTPLHCAARGDHLEVVKLLLSKGANLAAVNVTGNTPADEADDDIVKQALQLPENGAENGHL